MADRIALLLHMHQPDYRHPDDGVPQLPWVRLHAARGYTDVATLALEHGVAPTINVVPSLLEQLAAYGAGATDRWEDLSRVPAEDLTGAERDFIRRRFVHGNPNMRHASPRYRELEARVASLTAPGDLRDLQVWSNLAWVGSVGRRDPFLAELVAKDRGFSHEELLGLMDRQRSLVSGVLSLWRHLPSVSVSPQCHPILPLLVDFGHARRCLPALPPLGREATFRHPEDARRQLEDARRTCHALLGRLPRGLWPSEGSLSPEVLDLVAEAGFAWVATDEGLLERSDRQGGPRLDGPWARAADEAGLRVLFRDRDLSDRIGFRYQERPADEAVDDLLGALHARWGDAPGAVPVILDGENPWEAFADAGAAFMAALFSRSTPPRHGTSPAPVVVDLDRAAQVPTVGRITRLHTGSWIDADFRIWAGDEEDRRAWRLLTDLRKAWEEHGRPEAAWPHLANAESSDWFWWFGPEFHTEVADIFDALFRAHLRAGWQALGAHPPEALSHPVVDARADGPILVHAPVAGETGAPSRTAAAELPLPRGGAMTTGRTWLRGLRAAMGGGRLVIWIEAPHAELVLELSEVQGEIGALHGEHALVGAGVAEGPGWRRLELPWEPSAVRIAVRHTDGARHPATGWLHLCTTLAP